MARLRTKGLSGGSNTTGAQILARGGEVKANLISGAFQNLGATFERKKAREFSAEEAEKARKFTAGRDKEERKFRAEQAGLSRKQRQKNADRTYGLRKLQFLEKIGIESKAAQAKVLEEQEQLERLKQFDQSVPEGSKEKAKVQAEIAEREQGLPGLINRFFRSFSKFSNAGGDSEQLLKTIPDVEKLDREIKALDIESQATHATMRRSERIDPKGRKAAAQQKVNWDSGMDRIRAISKEKKALEQARDRAKKDSATALNSIQKKQERIAEYDQFESVAEGLLREGSVLKDDVVRAGRMILSGEIDAKQAFDGLKKINAARKARAVAEKTEKDKESAAARLEKERKEIRDYAEDLELTETEAMPAFKEMSEDKPDVGQAYRSLMAIKKAKDAAARNRDLNPIPIGGGDTRKAFDSEDGYIRARMGDYNDAAIAADLLTKSWTSRLVLELLEAKYKVSKMSLEQKIALGERLTLTRPGDTPQRLAEQEELARRLDIALKTGRGGK